MKVFVCLMAFVAVVNSQTNYGQTNYGPSINDVRQLVETLEQEVRGLYEDLSAGRTLCDVAQEKINYLNDVFWPRIQLVNDQQDERAVSYAAQIKAMQHRVDAAKADEREALSWAQKTAENTAEQYAYLFDPIGTDNDRQDKEIYRLHDDLTTSKQKYLEDLAYALNELNSELDDTREQVHNYVDVVDDRKCEYGTGSFSPRYDNFVRFKTPFLYSPEVSIFLTGFKSDLDLYSHEHYDGLALDKYVANVNTTGFTVKAVDSSEGMVQVDTVWCSWMACQGLVDDFVLSYGS